MRLPSKAEYPVDADLSAAAYTRKQNNKDTKLNRKWLHLNQSCLKIIELETTNSKPILVGGYIKR